MSEFIKVCEQAARAGGAVLLDWAGRFTVREKGPADLVTEADLASQAAIRSALLDRFPNHGFLAEEENASIPSRDDGYRWIVDPLDGTTNYVHGLPNYCVSIALEQHGKVLVATVYDPTAQECFTAVAGGGAFLNGKPLKVSAVERVSQALVAASLPTQVERESLEIAAFVEILLAAQAVRRLGSAALNLCYVAAGRLDAYWATATHCWDVAAGVLMVQEAGGVVTNLEGGELDLMRPRFVAASGRPLAAQLCELVATRK